MQWKVAFFETEILEFLSLKFLLLILKKKNSFLNQYIDLNK